MHLTQPSSEQDYSCSVVPSTRLGERDTVMAIVEGLSMHVVLVSMHTSPFARLGSGDAGGMNAILQAHAPELVRQGHTVDLITRRDSPDAADVVEMSPGLRLFHVTAGPATPLPKSRIDDYLDEFSLGLAALDLRPDLVHSHHWMSGVAALPVAREWGVAHLQSYHSLAALPDSPLSEGEPAESGRRVAGEAFTAQNSDLVVAVSDYEARTAINRCGADPTKVVVNRPGVDLELFRPCGPGEKCWRPEGTPAERPMAVFAARLQPLKAPDLAIAALAELPPARRPVLVIAGDTSADFADYWDELEAEIAALKMTQDVVHLGAQARPEFARLLRSSTVLLVPSFSETFGLVALEGQASALPVIAATSGGLPEAVGDDGILLSSRDPKVWAEAVAAVLDDPDAAGALGARARRHAEQFDWAGRVAELSAIYERMRR